MDALNNLRRLLLDPSMMICFRSTEYRRSDLMFVSPLLPFLFLVFFWFFFDIFCIIRLYLLTVNRTRPLLPIYPFHYYVRFTRNSFFRSEYRVKQDAPSSHWPMKRVTTSLIELFAAQLRFFSRQSSIRCTAVIFLVLTFPNPPTLFLENLSFFASNRRFIVRALHRYLPSYTPNFMLAFYLLDCTSCYPSIRIRSADVKCMHVMKL